MSTALIVGLRYAHFRTLPVRSRLAHRLEHRRDHLMRPIIPNRVATALHDRQPALRRERSRLRLDVLPKRFGLRRNAVVGRGQHD